MPGTEGPVGRWTVRATCRYTAARFMVIDLEARKNGSTTWYRVPTQMAAQYEWPDHIWSVHP